MRTRIECLNEISDKLTKIIEDLKELDKEIMEESEK